MKPLAALVCAASIAAGVWIVIEFSPLFLNSKIERVGEKNLPIMAVEKGGIIYCRMKADDFRFPLPPGAEAVNPVITKGGFDTVNGTVEAHLARTNQFTASEYEAW